MSRLPILSGRAVIKLLGKFGYCEVRQRGSHIRLSSASRKSVTVPNYKTIDRSLLQKIMRDAEITFEDLEKFMKNI